MAKRCDTIRSSAGGEHAFSPSACLTAAVQNSPDGSKAPGASFVYRMRPADRFGGDPLARAQHGSGTRARTSTLLPAQDHGGLNDRRLCHRTRVCLGPVPYSSQPVSGDARKIGYCPSRNSAAGVRVPDWQCLHSGRPTERPSDRLGCIFSFLGERQCLSQAFAFFLFGTSTAL